MDREYILIQLLNRIEVLKDRYKLACHGKDDAGITRGTFAMANTRHTALKELHLCMLIEELIRQIKTPLCELSDEAIDGLEKLMTPIERHRRLRNAE